ncbi:MAG: FG-GAP-like repeat-containing protein [Ginsengibacter sp.]
MPVKFFKNDHGHFKDVTPVAISNKSGWWNSMTCGDFDDDGDIDYVAGNLGENSFYQASDKYPVSIYGKDFFKKGITQCIITQYLKDQEGGQLKEFTINSRDEIVDQLPFIKKRFLTYKDFAQVTFDKIFTADEISNALKDSANYFKSSFIRNNGNDSFTMEPLPGVAQYSAINGMVTEDFDSDGNLDICMNTNEYSTDPSNERYDALNGLILIGDGKGKFTSLSILQSGIFYSWQWAGIG